MTKPAPLRTQLTTAMVLVVVVTMAIALVAALITMRMQRMSAAGAGVEFAGVGELDPIVLAAVAGGSAVIGAIIAVLVARRLVPQLEAVAEAAARLAAGDLSARCDAVAGAAAETLMLAESFNAMAVSIERLQRLTTDSSAAIAHELRTPLAILLGRLHGIREGIFTADHDSIASLVRQVEALGRIVDDLSVVSLAASRRLVISPVNLALRDTMSSILDDVRPRLAAADIILRADVPAIHARADPDRLRQAVLALVENVLQHAAQGGEVLIRARHVDAAVRIEVLDRGPGLAPDELALLFEPFWRRAGERRTNGNGTGLGLSVVASIARAHGGNAMASPRQGGGAIFSLVLPDINPLADI